MRSSKKIHISLLSVIIVLIAVYSIYIYTQIPSCSNSKNKVVHISFDDVFLCLKDLKDTVRYKSIYQQPFFKSLKEFHDEYGAVFTLYVYEVADDFIITEVPTKYKAEFIENSSWMKFGYHALKPCFEEEEQSKEFERSLTVVNNSINHWAGKLSLGSCLRLHYYYADNDMVSALKKHKIYHLLGADDKGRKSYNLNQLQSDSLYNKRAYIYDSINFYKTDIRIERMNYIPFELFYLQNKDTITLFSHEWAMVGRRNVFNRMKLKSSMRWLNKNGYKFTFLE